jgi:hypothetical protein
MTYFIANNLDLDVVMCDSCADKRWETHPKYGTNVHARLAEEEETGIRWGWDRRYSSEPRPCVVCREMTK